MDNLGGKGDHHDQEAGDQNDDTLKGGRTDHGW